VVTDDVLYGFRLRLFSLAAELGNVRQACRIFGVHPSTYYRWRGPVLRSGLEMLRPRERRPPRMPNQTSPLTEQRIVAFSLGHPGSRPAPDQREPRPGPLGRDRHQPQRVWRVLRRHGLNRLASLEPPKPPAIRYEREHPGELLHLDIKKLGRFARPGVRATGDRTHRNPGAGVESLHVAIDDHSRFAFASLHPDEKIPSALDALLQAVAFYKDHGIKIERLLTDRGSTYRSKLFASTCHQLGIQHRFTRPYRPQTNGKAERFIQTITRAWAYARSYDSSDHRATFLPHYLHDYNFHRPHSALNSLAPSSRLPKTADNVSRRNS